MKGNRLERHVFIYDLDAIVDRILAYLHVESPSTVIFDRLRMGPPVRGAGFAAPMHRLLDALQWMWLAWHKHQRREEVFPTLQKVIQRSIEASKDPQANPYLRPDHDSFLIQLAIISGDDAILRQTCEGVRTSSDVLTKDHYLQAWTGVLRYRILRDAKAERDSWECMKSHKPHRVFAWPDAKLVEAFVQRDYRKVSRIVHRHTTRHWAIAEKEGALGSDATGRFVFFPERKRKLFYWPWVEACFARLARLEGADIRCDDFWAPQGLVGP